MWITSKQLKALGLNIYSGVIVAFTIAASATLLSEQYGAPVMLFALLIAIALHFLTEASKCESGMDLAAKSVLAVIGLIATIIILGVVVSKFFGRGLRFGRTLI